VDAAEREALAWRNIDERDDAHGDRRAAGFGCGCSGALIPRLHRTLAIVVRRDKRFEPAGCSA
jgi:hypothetical protein